MRTLSPATVRLPARPLSGPQAGRVLRITDGALFVELEAADGLEVGPCAWSRPMAQPTEAHSHSTENGPTGDAYLSYDPGDPPPGTRCLLLFAGTGIADPWVVAFDGWPA